MSDARITRFGDIRCFSIGKQKRLSFDITVEIEYPEDIPDGMVRDFAQAPAEWILNYAKAQARMEEKSHRE